MSPLATYLVVLDGVLVATWVGWYLVLRAANREYDRATAVAIAGATDTIAGRPPAQGAVEARFLVHWDRAQDLDRIASYLRRGQLAIGAVVLFCAAAVLIP